MTLEPSTPGDFGWLTRITGYQPRAGFRGISALSKGRLVGLVGFDGWTPASVSMHVALAGPWAGRRLLGESFRYVFVECGRRLARGEVRGENQRVLALALHLGFRQVRVVRDGWDVGEDLIQLEMRRDECRWLEEHHGQRDAGTTELPRCG